MMRQIATLSLLIAMCGCTLTRGSAVLIGNQRPASDPDRVQLLTELPAKYERIALIEADSRNDFASQQNLTENAIKRLRKEAAKVGANAILLNGIGNYTVGTSGIATLSTAGSFTAGTMVGVTRTGKAAKGVAVFVPSEK